MPVGSFYCFFFLFLFIRCETQNHALECLDLPWRLLYTYTLQLLLLLLLWQLRSDRPLLRVAPAGGWHLDAGAVGGGGETPRAMPRARAAI